MYCFECKTDVIKLVNATCPIHNISASYYIEDGTVVGESDSERFYSYEVVHAFGTSIKEFLDTIAVSKVDQDGEDIDIVGFDDVPSRIQDVILNLAKLSWDDIKE